MPARMAHAAPRTDRQDEEEAATARPSRVEGAYETLKTAIRDNLFAPGYQGSEGEIAASLGMSRTPVHEAIIRLQEEGLVRVLPRRGVVILAISPDDMREIYEATIALEAASAGLLASKPEAMRAAIADELDGVNDSMQAALDADNLPAWAEADGRFHQLLVERTGNGRLARMAATMVDQSHRARMLTIRLRPKPVSSVLDHRAIVAAIRAGDAALARDCAQTHRAAARDMLLPLLAQLGMRHL